MTQVAWFLARRLSNSLESLRNIATFNLGVEGSSPSGLTKFTRKFNKLPGGFGINYPAAPKMSALCPQTPDTPASVSAAGHGHAPSVHSPGPSGHGMPALAQGAGDVGATRRQGVASGTFAVSGCPRLLDSRHPSASAAACHRMPSDPARFGLRHPYRPAQPVTTLGLVGRKMFAVAWKS